MEHPTPLEIMLAIQEEILDFNRANPDRRMPVEAMSIVRAGIKNANAQARERRLAETVELVRGAAV